MHEYDPDEDIRATNGTDDSIDDQIGLRRFLIWCGITSRRDAISKGPIRDLLKEYGVELEHTLDTVLGNLFESGFLNRYFPEQGADAILVSERIDEVVFDTWEDKVLPTDQAALIDHIRAMDGSSDITAWTDGGVGSLRRVIADEFDGIDPEKVEVHLREGPKRAQRKKLNRAIEAIEEEDSVEPRETYGKIVWRHKGYRYWVPRRTE